jgi:hypothetical protein
MIKHDIFLSYSHADDEIVKAIRKSLEIFGFSIWIDETGIPIGTPSWKKAIQEGIEGAFCLVVVLSPDAKNSQWVNEELDYAKTHDRQVFAILAKGDDKKSIPFGFSSHQRVDIRASYIPLVNDLIPAICKALEIHISPKQHYTKKDPKDIRVAQRLDNAIGHSLLFLCCFVSKVAKPNYSEEEYKETWKVFTEDFPDRLDTGYPDSKHLAKIIEKLGTLSFLEESNMQVGGKPLNWLEMFIFDLNDTNKACNEILLHYSARDDKLIALVEDIREQSEFLIWALQSQLTSPEVYQRWGNGVPQHQYAGFVRHYYLTILKAKRIIREFVPNTPS